MIESRVSHCETEALELLRKSTDAQLAELPALLDLSRDHIPKQGALATRYAEIWDLAKRSGGSTLARLDDILREQQQQPAPHYWLYLSCSDAARKDALSRRFFDDLIARLRGHFPGKNLRYFDEGNPEKPTTWSPWSLRAMRQSQVLVCLFDKTFFSDPYCGQVWRAFRERWREAYHVEQPELGCPLIFPVLWGSPDEYPSFLPPAVQDVVVQHETPGSTYAVRGLHFLIKQAMAKRGLSEPEYDALLDRFAASLLQMSQGYPLRTDMDVPDLSGIETEFYRPAQEDTLRSPASADVKFIYLAGRREEMRQVRRKVEGYGDDERRWLPYHPESEINIQTLSFQAATQTDLVFDPVALDNQFSIKIADADKNRCISVLLVDPWTLRRAEYSDLAQAYDGLSLAWSVVFLCWNGSDHETVSKRHDLERDIRRALQRRFQNRSPSRWYDGIETDATLRAELPKALLAIKQAIADSLAPLKVAVGTPFLRPDLVVSSSASVLAVDVRSAESGDIGLVHQPRVEGPSGGVPR